MLAHFATSSGLLGGLLECEGFAGPAALSLGGVGEVRGVDGGVAAGLGAADGALEREVPNRDGRGSRHLSTAATVCQPAETWSPMSCSISSRLRAAHNRRPCRNPAEAAMFREPLSGTTVQTHAGIRGHIQAESLAAQWHSCLLRPAVTLALFSPYKRGVTGSNPVAPTRQNSLNFIGRPCGAGWLSGSGWAAYWFAARCGDGRLRRRPGRCRCR
jgi:hypothetical protein